MTPNSGKRSEKVAEPQRPVMINLLAASNIARAPHHPAHRDEREQQEEAGHPDDKVTARIDPQGNKIFRL